MKGLVLQTTGSWYTIRLDNGDRIKSRLRGKLRLGGEKLTNPVAVGDLVELIRDKESNELVISRVDDRKNYIVRQSPRKKFHKHIIAANIDLAILVTSILKPRTPLGFIDRFLVATESYHIPSIIVVNKKDIIKDKKAQKKLEQLVEIYSSLGYDVLLTSTVTGEGINALREIMRDKVSLFSGYSGVGKSSLTNALNPELNLKTTTISRKSEKGMHTTTFAEMHAIAESSFIIDTPGIKELGIVNVEPEELSGYFIEMRPLTGNCKFNNCMHRDEPSCAILEAVEQGEISISRYNNYLAILESLEEINYWERN